MGVLVDLGFPSPDVFLPPKTPPCLPKILGPRSISWGSSLDLGFPHPDVRSISWGSSLDLGFPHPDVRSISWGSLDLNRARPRWVSGFSKSLMRPRKPRWVSG